MPRTKGDGARFVVGPRAGSSPQIEPWSEPDWTAIKASLGSEQAILPAVREQVLKATNRYVKYSTKYETKPGAEIKYLLKRWRQSTQGTRKKIWSRESELTSWRGSRADRKLKLKDINRKYLKKKLSRLAKSLRGHPRHLLVGAAVGMDIGLAFCDYALQEIENPERASRQAKLWYVWVALLLAILRDNCVAPTHFNDFVSKLQSFLPDECAKHAAGESLNRYIMTARKFGRTASVQTLSTLLSYWGAFDRVRRSDDPALLNLLKQAHLLQR